jgi:hypothetical protein
MALQIPRRPELIDAAFVSELVDTLHPGTAIDDLEIVGIKSYGDADNATSVSTSARVRFRVRYRHDDARLPEQLLAKDAGKSVISSRTIAIDFVHMAPWTCRRSKHSCSNTAARCSTASSWAG